MAAFAVAGTVLQITITSTLTTVPSVTNLAFSGGERGDINVTAISDEDEVFIGGRRAAQELTFDIYEDPSNAVHQAILANYAAASATAVVWNLIDGDTGAATHAFSGYVKTYARKRDVDGAGMANVAVKLTTAITTTP